MGNCLRHESPMTWGGEDWGSPAEDHRIYGEMTEKVIMEIEEKGLLRNEKSHVSTSSNGNNNYGTNYKNGSTTTTEVKIKITKRELEELLGKVNVNDMSVQQVLAQLIDVSNSCQTQQLRSWRPALQSIPELN